MAERAHARPTTLPSEDVNRTDGSQFMNPLSNEKHCFLSPRRSSSESTQTAPHGAAAARCDDMETVAMEPGQLRSPNPAALHHGGRAPSTTTITTTGQHLSTNSSSPPPADAKSLILNRLGTETFAPAASKTHSQRTLTFARAPSHLEEVKGDECAELAGGVWGIDRSLERERELALWKGKTPGGKTDAERSSCWYRFWGVKCRAGVDEVGF